MSVEPEDELLDDEIELADAEEYVPEERRKKRTVTDRKARVAARKKRAEAAAGTVHPGGMAKIYRLFTEKGLVTNEEIEALEPEDRDALVLEPRIFEEPPTRVGAWASATVNMGDFNSVKFGAFMAVNCYFAEREDAFSFVKEWVTEAVNKEIEEAKGTSSSPATRRAGRRAR